MRKKTTIIFAYCILLLANTINGYAQKATIVATTGIIADAVKNVVKENFQVIALMGAGVDPHAYKATPGDLDKIKKADIIFYNGLHLEGKMDYIFKKLATVRKIYPISNALAKEELITDPDFEFGIDPHIWFDIALWQKVISYISQIMQNHDQANAEQYKQNAIAYINRLTLLNEKVKNELNSIPIKNRILITSHDAFSYFGKAYNMKVKSLQGISTMSEYGLKDRMEIANFIIENKIKAIFIETSVSDKSMQAVVENCKLKGYHVTIGPPLYSDAMGQENTPEGTYEGMLTANVTAIAKCLK
jgi:manganese/zinc/iron transport system substrate-binding protein